MNALILRDRDRDPLNRLRQLFLEILNTLLKDLLRRNLPHPLNVKVESIRASVVIKHLSILDRLLPVRVVATRPLLGGGFLVPVVDVAKLVVGVVFEADG